MTKTITKMQIIKALQREPLLKRGAWFKFNKSRGTYNKSCSVCAVGCILRAVSFERWARKKQKDLAWLGQYFADVPLGADAFFLIHTKNYLTALSLYFESGHSRKKCIAFVRRYFPDLLRLTISKENIERLPFKIGL